MAETEQIIVKLSDVFDLQILPKLDGISLINFSRSSWTCYHLTKII